MADNTHTKIEVALAGNPNCGKTSIFNNMTGSRQHVGNYAGVTVEKKLEMRKLMVMTLKSSTYQVRTP